MYSIVLLISCNRFSMSVLLLPWPSANKTMYIPEGQIAKEKQIYQSLRDLYKSPKENSEYGITFDNGYELVLLPFTYPASNITVITTNKISRHDYIVKGSYCDGFKILYRYDRMGCVTRIIKVDPEHSFCEMYSACI